MRIGVVWALALLGAAQEGRRPNVLFLFADDQRFDTIRELGNPEIVTPNLDGLVREGTAFIRAYIPGGDQPAVCVPSRAMLLTGRHFFRMDKGIPDGVPMWTELMRDAGYVTFGTGKWHNGPRTYARGFVDGGPVFFGGMGDQAKVRVQDFDPAGKYAKGRERIGEKYSTELFADGAVRFLEGHKGEKPFFLYCAFTSPHDPRTPPRKYADLYDPAKLALPKSFLPEHPFDNGELKVRDEQLAPWPRTPEVVRRHVADYYGMISHLDAEIGRILETLRKKGLAEETIVVFAGDNGLALGRHGLFGKQNVYDPSVHVPLVMRGPGIPKGKRSEAMCYLLDVMPTVLEKAGIARPEGLDGRSLVPVIAGGKAKHRESLLFAYRTFQRAVQDERWKLIEYDVAGKRTTQLFDLAEDPEETRSLAGEPAQAAIVDRLRAELARLQKEWGDPLSKGR
ncbi:MAG TPA: sulfatase-like hydrolase/transferase [Planctomycetota bacterium]|nr:sulfatase-like hydrolase/transferase [Planctomycetota bacterium]